MPDPYRPRASLLVWRSSSGSGDTPTAILRLVIERLKVENRVESAREISLAVTHCQEALHWLDDLETKRSTST